MNGDNQNSKESNYNNLSSAEKKAKFMANNRVSHQENYYYGVDTNNRAAVEAEYLKLKKRHQIFTIVAVILIIALGVIFFDFYRVNNDGKKPIFAIKQRIDNGDKYVGIGYTAIYCDDGEQYIGALNKTCNPADSESMTFDQMFYDAFMKYVKDKDYIDESNFVKMDFVSVTFDETNKEGFSDYLVDIHYVCSDTTANCFHIFKEVGNQNHVQLYVSLNNYNQVYDIKAFKKSGVYYDSLKEKYKNKLIEYMSVNGLLNKDNLRSFDIEFIDTYGKFEYGGISYADSYEVSVTYLCNDNSNTCVTPFESEEFSNFSFELAMLLDLEDNVSLIKHTKIFRK